jgi:hypothetical protein
MERLEIGQQEFVITIHKIAHLDGEIIIILAALIFAQARLLGIILEITPPDYAKKSA